MGLCVSVFGLSVELSVRLSVGLCVSVFGLSVGLCASGQYFDLIF